MQRTTPDRSRLGALLGRLEKLAEDLDAYIHATGDQDSRVTEAADAIREGHQKLGEAYVARLLRGTGA